MLNLSELNALDREKFTRLIGPVFENSPWIAEETWAARPFASRSQLHGALCKTVARADDDAKLELIRAHPDLAGRIKLTSASRREQATAKLNELSEEELAQLNYYNGAYRDKFGFPFVICARLNDKEKILEAFPTRLQNSIDEEKRIALDEIFKIADLRLLDILE